MAINKNLKGADFGNPYQAPYALNEYSQNVPAPTHSGGGPAYQNPLSQIEKQFFDPATPNDPQFSDMQAPQEVSLADPMGQIMSDFKAAQSRLPNNGGK